MPPQQQAQPSEQMQSQLREQADRIQNLTNQVTTQGKLLIALDDTQQHMKAQLELDFLIVSEKFKQEVTDALSGEAAGKALRAFKKVIELLAEAKPPVPGAADLHALSEQDMKRLVLGFSSPFKTSMEGKPWKFVLKTKLEATALMRDHLANLAFAGGNARIQVRRPLPRQGKLAADVEQWSAPDKAATRKEKQEARVAKAKAKKAAADKEKAKHDKAKDAKAGARPAASYATGTSSASGHAPVSSAPPGPVPAAAAAGMSELLQAAGANKDLVVQEVKRRSQSRSRSPTTERSPV